MAGVLNDVFVGADDSLGRLIVSPGRHVQDGLGHTGPHVKIVVRPDDGRNRYASEGVGLQPDNGQVYLQPRFARGGADVRQQVASRDRGLPLRLPNRLRTALRAEIEVEAAIAGVTNSQPSA